MRSELILKRVSLLFLIMAAGCHRSRLDIQMPAGIEQARNVGCRVVLTSGATGGCEDFHLTPGAARFWRSCGYIELPDRRSEQTLKTSESWAEVQRACATFVRAVRDGARRGK